LACERARLIRNVAHEEMSHDPRLPACLNCGGELHGRFCHGCGQKATRPILDIHDFLHEATHEFMHLDGKIVTSMKLLATKPGQLTKDFIEGRRARYISPIRVYLTFSLLFFGLFAIVPGASESLVRVNEPKGASQPAVKLEAVEAKYDELRETLMHNLPRVAFLLMPVFAVLTWLLYRREQPYYIPHLYYAIHFHAFVFLVLGVALLLCVAAKGGGGAMFLVVFPYHYIALRRVFGGSRWRSFAKGTAVGVLYRFTMALAMLTLVWVTTRSLG
jgi:hypothetical protein